MKNRLGIVVLALVCLGLFIAIVTVKRQATAEKTAVIERAETASNQTWVQINGKVEELKNVNTQLEKDAQAQKSNYDKALMGEKTEVERQFNDLNVLRAQVAKLKTEQNIARRIEWMRNGLYASADEKGAQRLMTGISAPTPTGKSNPIKSNYDLNVEV